MQRRHAIGVKICAPSHDKAEQASTDGKKVLQRLARDAGDLVTYETHNTVKPCGW
jgi:hypothetical protein